MKYGAELGRATVALLLAGSLWLIVSAEETTAEWVSVRIALDLDSTVTLADAPPPVRAYVVGRRRDLFKLISSPPTLQRAITEDDRDSVRIELRAQDLDMPTGTDVTVRDLRPRLLTFRLRRRNGEPMVQDLLNPDHRPDSARDAIQPDTVLDSIARAKFVADSIKSASAIKRDSMMPLKRDSVPARRPPQ